MIYTADQITESLVAFRESNPNPVNLSSEEQQQFKTLLNSDEAKACVGGSIDGLLEAIKAGAPSKPALEATLYAMIHIGMQIGVALKIKELEPPDAQSIN